MAARDGADGGTGSARRRRERRLRSWLKHERMAIAAVLATVTHHSFRKVGTASGVLRNQKTATRTGNGEEYESHFTAKIRKTPPPAGSQPALLPEVAGWQVPVEPHVMEDLGSVCPFVQILDLPVPQMVDYVADALRILDRPIAEQVFEVPQFSCSSCPSRSLIPEPQVAEQLMEVPTVLSLLRIAEQIVGTPVPLGRGGRISGFQGSLPGQSATSTHSSGKRISERIVEQIVDFPAQTVEQIVCISPGGGLGQGSASSAGAADEDFTQVFRTLPQVEKSAKLGPHLSPRVPASVSSSTLAAQLEDAPVPDSDEWMQFLRRRTEEKEKELKAEEEEDEDPTGWTLAYDSYGRQYFWHRRTRHTAWRDSGIRHTEDDEDEEEEETSSWFLIVTLLSCTDTAMWAWTRSRSP